MLTLAAACIGVGSVLFVLWRRVTQHNGTAAIATALSLVAAGIVGVLLALLAI